MPFVMVPVLWERLAIEWIADAIVMADFDSNSLISLKIEHYECQIQERLNSTAYMFVLRYIYSNLNLDLSI